MSYYFANVVVDDGVDGAVLAALTGADGDDVAAAMATLRSGGVVVTDPWHVVDGTAILTATQPDPAEPAEPVEPAGQATEQELVVPAYVLASSVRPDLTFVPPAVVAEAGLASQAVALVAQTSAAPTTAQRDALTAALQAIEPELSMYVEQGSASGSDPSLLILAGAAAVVTLGAAGIATGLAAADRRGDLSTLGAVGASPRVRRLLALSQSGVIAGLGTVLGAVAGAGAALAVLVALNQRYTGVWPSPTPYPIEIPWSSLAILLTVPLVAMLGAGLLTRSRLPIERRAAG